MFLFVKPTITVDCFTRRSYVFEYAKVNYARQFIPKWWKELPKQKTQDFVPMNTMKRCAGFVELYKQGLIIPMWSDFALELGKQGTALYRWQYSDHMSSASEHDFSQWGGYFSPFDYLHLKLISPWYVKCNKNLKWVWFQPAWSFTQIHPYQVMPGIVEYKYQYGTNINMFFKRHPTDTQNILIEFGQPMVQMVPMTDAKIKLKHHLVSDEEWDRIHLLHTGISFTKKYQLIKKLKGQHK